MMKNFPSIREIFFGAELLRKLAPKAQKYPEREEKGKLKHAVGRDVNKPRKLDFSEELNVNEWTIFLETLWG